MDNWRSELQKGMDLLGMWLLFNSFCDMFNAFVRPDLEEKAAKEAHRLGLASIFAGDEERDRVCC